MEEEMVALTVCCQTGHRTVTALTPEEVAEKRAADEAWNKARVEAEAERASLLSAVQASTDPAVQALAKLLMS
jgi:hypothetical protein